MAPSEISRDQLRELMNAVQISGNLEHLRLEHSQFIDYLAALVTFMGGPVDSVDAFLSDIPDHSRTDHQVWWLRGNTIGSLVVQAHKGAEGQQEPAEVSGYVRPLSSIKRVEFGDVDFVYPRFGGREIPEVRPTVRIHLDDKVVVVHVAGRGSEGGRDQAERFISRLLTKLSTLGSA